MARLQSPKSTLASAWHEYGGWVIIIFTVYVLWTFRKVFSSVGDAAGETVAATVATAQATAQTKAEKAKVQQTTGTKTNYTDAQLAGFRADANTLAGYFGTLVGGGWQMFAQDGPAFSLLKQHYSRLKLVNNKPCIQVGKAAANGTMQVKNVTVETSACIKNTINYKVLISYYKDATGGRDLVSDIRKCITDADMVAYLKWIL